MSQALAEREQEDALRKLLEHRGGRQFLFRMFASAHVWSATTFTGNSHTFFNEGQRSLALLMQREIEAIDPAIMCKLKKEFGNG